MSTITEVENNYNLSLEVLKLLNVSMNGRVPCIFTGCIGEKTLGYYNSENKLAAKCFSCGTHANFRQIIKNINNLTNEEYIGFMTDLGYESDIHDESKVQYFTKILYSKKTQDYNKNILDHSLKDRKISNNTMMKYTISNFKFKLLSFTDDQKNKIFSSIGGELNKEKTNDQKINLISYNDSFIIPLFTWNHEYNGLIIISPLESKEFRYKNWLVESKINFLFEETLRNKDKTIFITEGIYTSLKLLDLNFRTLSSLGANANVLPERLIKLLNEFPNIKSIGFCFDVDKPGIVKTQKFLENILKELEIKKIQLKIFIPRIQYKKYHAFDDLLNENKTEKLSLYSYNTFFIYSYLSKIENYKYSDIITALIQLDKRKDIIRNSKKYILELSQVTYFSDNELEKMFNQYKKISEKLSHNTRNLIYTFIDSLENIEVNNYKDLEQLKNKMIKFVKEN